MKIEKNENVGGLVISNEVLAKIASDAAKDVDGVLDLIPATVSIKDAIAGEKLLSGVKISYTSDHSVIFDIFVRLKQDARVKETAADIQKNVKYAVMNMTGKPVAKVNVIVADIAFSGAEEK